MIAFPQRGFLNARRDDYQDVKAHVASADVSVAVLFALNGADEAVDGVPLGRIPPTLVQRQVSSLRLSRGVLGPDLGPDDLSESREGENVKGGIPSGWAATGRRLAGCSETAASWSQTMPASG